MKQKIEKIALAVLLTLAVVLSSVAFAFTYRAHTVHWLSVNPGTPGSGKVNTNAAEFTDFTLTNRVGVSTSFLNAAASVVGPRLYTTLGGTNRFAVTNRTLIITNGGVVRTNVFINGLLVDDFSF